MTKGLLIFVFALSARAEFPQLDIQQRSFNPIAQGTAVALDGNLGYRTGPSTLTIEDLTDPRVPVARGSVPIPATCMGMAVRDGRAYLALGTAGFQIVDVSNPAQPRLLGSFDTHGSAQEVAVIPGRVACVADGAGGLQLIDISNETQLRSVRSFPTATLCEYVVVDGSFAYASASDAVTIVSLADPATPAAIGSIPLPAGAASKGLAKIGSHVIAATGTPGLIWYDVSDPEIPRETGRIEKNCIGVLTHNRMALANFFNEPAVVYDFTRPAAPDVIGRIGQPAGKAAFSGHFLYSAGYAHVFEFQLANPQMIGRSEPFGGVEIEVRNGLAFVARANLGIYDVASSPAPILIGQFPHTSAVGVALHENHAFIAGSDGLTVVNIANPTNPTFVANLPSPANAEDVVVENSRAFIRSRAAIGVVDISNPSNPQTLGFYETSNLAMKILPGGETMFIATVGSVARVLDVRDPAAPIETASFSIRNGAQSMELSGNYLFLCCGPSGLFIYDVANLADVRQVASRWAATSNGPFDLAIVGDFAYVARGGLTVLDISIPAQPREVGHNNLQSFVQNLVATDGRVYAIGNGILAVYNEYRPPNYALTLQPLLPDSGAFTFRLTGPPGAKANLERAEIMGDWNPAATIDLAREQSIFSKT